MEAKEITMALATNHTLTPEEVATIEAALKGTKEGLTSFDLQRVLFNGTMPSATLNLRILMHQLRQKNVVKTKGQLRGMKYIWISQDSKPKRSKKVK
jgi:hypothetical protein